MARREDTLLQERVLLPYDHAQVTADTTVKLWQVPAGRKFRLDRVYYNNPTGLAVDASNFYNIAVQKNDGVTPVVMANHSTETGEEGTLTGDTPVELVLAADGAARVADAGDDIELLLDEDGTATLPAGRVVIEGRLL
jgi:hypothetical protein